MLESAFLPGLFDFLSVLTFHGVQVSCFGAVLFALFHLISLPHYET